MNLSIPSKQTIVRAVVPLGFIALSVALLPRALEFFNYVKDVLAYPYVWALTENENLLFIHGIFTGHNFYDLKQSDAFVYFVYPPFFHAICAGIMKLFGFKIFIPRLITLISLFTLFSLLFSFFKEKVSKLENAVLTLLLVSVSLSNALYAKYYVLVRADMLAFALAFGSVYVAWLIVHKNNNRPFHYFLSGGLALAAVLTKQSVFFPYLVIAGLILFTKDWKNWLKFIVYLGGATIVAFLSLNYITSGGFWQSMQLASEIYGKYLNSTKHLFLLQHLFVKHYWPLLTSIPLLVVLAFRREHLIPFSLFIFAALYLNFIFTGGNEGAEYNTLIPLLFGLGLVVKEFYSVCRELKTNHFFLMIFFLLLVFQVIVSNSILDHYLLPTAADRDGQATLVSQIGASQGQSVLGDRVDFAIFLAGKNSPLEASTHVNARQWHQTAAYANNAEATILKRLQNKEIDTAVITITNFGNGALLDYIKTHGTLVETVKINYIDAPDFPHKIYRLNR